MLQKGCTSNDASRSAMEKTSTWLPNYFRKLSKRAKGSRELLKRKKMETVSFN